ncbi:MAG TPA: hypothetical protein VGM05_13125 [Planctomycetaceae bacterium]
MRGLVAAFVFVSPQELAACKIAPPKTHRAPSVRFATGVYRRLDLRR